jgi:hypothetical protein
MITSRFIPEEALGAIGPPGSVIHEEQLEADEDLRPPPHLLSVGPSLNMPSLT